MQGDRIGKGKDYFARYRSSVNMRIKERKTWLKNYTKRMNRRIDRANSKGDTEKVEELMGKLQSGTEEREENLKIYTDISLELDKMENCEDVTFNIISGLDLDTEQKVDGNFTYDAKTKEFNIRFENGYKSGTIAHEMKHGFQFLSGKLSFNMDGSPGLLYDLQDEREAYDRGALFGAPKISFGWIKMKYPKLPVHQHALNTDTSGKINATTNWLIHFNKKNISQIYYKQ